MLRRTRAKVTALSINEVLTLILGLSSLVIATVSAIVAYWTYRVAEDSTDMKNAIVNLSKLANSAADQSRQAAEQTALMHQNLVRVEQALQENRAQTKSLSGQANSLALQAKHTQALAASGAAMAATSAQSVILQQRSLYYSTSPRLTMDVDRNDGGRIANGILNLSMTLRVTLQGRDPVKKYGIAALLAPGRIDGQFKPHVNEACELADWSADAWNHELEKTNLAGVQAEASLESLRTPYFYNEPPSIQPVYIACASYRSPIDDSRHHVAVVSPVTLAESRGFHVPFTNENRILPPESLRRVDFPGYSD